MTDKLPEREREKTKMSRERNRRLIKNSQSTVELGFVECTMDGLS